VEGVKEAVAAPPPCHARQRFHCHYVWMPPATYTASVVWRAGCARIARLQDDRMVDGAATKINHKQLCRAHIQQPTFLWCYAARDTIIQIGYAGTTPALFVSACSCWCIVTLHHTALQPLNQKCTNHT
jgi:hypothetical protein